MKAQGALEYLIIIAAVLGISAVVVLFVTGVFTGSIGGADISKCRVAAANCQRDLTLGLGTSCTQCDAACVDASGKDLISKTPGCGDACLQCKKGVTIGAGSTPVTGIVAQWSFEEGKGGFIADSSGQLNNATFYGTRHNGALVGGATRTSGKYGNAVSLDGISGNVRIGNVGSLTQGTIMLWVRFNRLHTSSIWEGIVQGVYASGSTFHMFNYNDGNGIAFFTNMRSTTKPVVGTWYHLAMTWDGVNKFAYVNGVLEAQGAGAYPADLSDLALGEYQSGTFLSGSIDSFRVFDKNMTKGQIQAEMNSQIAANRSILDLEFDESSGVANDTRMWVKGKSGTALAFNGVDDQLYFPVSTTIPTNFANKGEWTFEGWILHEGNSPQPYSAIFWGDVHKPRFWWYNGSGTSALNLCAYLVDTTYQCFASVSPAPTSDVFHHIVALQSASRGVSEIWVDGVKAASGAFRQVTSGTSGYNLAGGQGGTEEFKGIIDEVHLYNRSLSDAEIIALYNAHSEG